MGLASSTVEGVRRPLDEGAFEAGALHEHFAHTVVTVACLRPAHAGGVGGLVRHAHAVVELEGPGVFLVLTSQAGCATEVRDCLLQPGILAMSLTHAECTPGQHRTLLDLCGADQLHGLVRMLAEAPTKSGRVAAVAVLSSLPAGEVERGLSTGLDPSPSLAALSLVPECDVGRGLLVCGVFQGHRDASVRAEALRTHALVQTPTDAMFGDALRDENEVVASQALRLLTNDDHARALILRELMARSMPDSRFDMLALALIGRGEAGLVGTARALSELAASAERGRAALADRLATHLRPHAGHPDVARVLRKYRLSFSRLLAFMFPEGRSQPTKKKSAA